MRYSGSRLVHEPTLGTGLVPIKNRPGNYIRVAWEDAQRFKPYEVFERADGSLIVQNILGKKQPLETFMPGTWVHVGFTEHL